MSGRRYDRPPSAPIEATPSKNAMMLDVIREALDSLKERMHEAMEVEREERRAWTAIAKANREALVEIIGRDGRGGQVGQIHESRIDQGRRIGSLEREVTEVKTTIQTTEHRLKTEITNLGWRTKIGFLAIAGATGATGAGLFKILEALF